MADRGVRGAVATAATTAVVWLGACAHPGALETTPPDGTATTQATVLPWQWWRDLTTLAVVPDGDRTVMRSSYCEPDCEYDRHSPGDSRFLRVDDRGEGVIFEADGAGALTRIWMVTGDGISEPLDPSIRIRVRLDGNRKPAIDLPLPGLFDGSTPPFLPPLVADRETSGGGHISYVPVPFRDGCVVSLVGADQAKLWFQVTARLVDDASSVSSFTGREDLSGLRALLEHPGADPWRTRPSSTISGEVTLAPGAGETIAELEGPETVSGIILRTGRENWQRIGLRFTFDDREPQLVPAFDLFGVGWANQQVARSVLFGADRDDDLYCYFPMPFASRAKVEIMRRPVEGPPGVRVEYAVRLAGEPPDPRSGSFTVQVRQTDAADGATEHTFFEEDGSGVLVGVFARFGPAGGPDWSFLEGDEKIRLDGEPAASWHGTGVEDFFGGGFYFRGSGGRPEPFLQPLHGAPVVQLFHRAATTSYRLLLGDAVPFHDGIVGTVERRHAEAGQVGLRSVAFWYRR